VGVDELKEAILNIYFKEGNKKINYLT